MATSATTYFDFAFHKQLPPPKNVLHDPRAEFMKNCCDQSKGTAPNIFIPKFETFSDERNRIRKIEVGKKYMNPPVRVIMVVGGTGSGKSTLINAMYNHMCGVEWEDNFRFKLIEEYNKKSQAHSQTEWVTAYTIHHQPWFAVPYTLIFIDTPGLGDTTGIQKDEEIKEQIRQCFTTTEDHGIDQLDDVALVEPATSLRLTPTHRYILESTLSLFGKDIDDNVFLLLPFADEGTPGILSTLKELQVKFKKHFNFNNVGLFSSNVQSPFRDMIQKQCWEMGQTSFKAFVAELDNVQPKSLKLSAETLNERRALEFAVNRIQGNITSMVYYLHQLSTEDQVLQRCQAGIDSNKNYRYEVTVCDTDWLASGKERFQLEQKTTNELKKRYGEEGEAFTAKQLIEKCVEELSKRQDETLDTIHEASQWVVRLREIALRPTIMSTADYIEILISRENVKHSKGWKQRKRQLRLLKKRAKIHNVVAQTHSISEKYIEMYQLERNKVLSLSLICQKDINGRTSIAEEVKNIPVYKTTCPVIMHKNRRKYSMTVAFAGKQKSKLQAPDSDVSLNIPRKASGVFFSHVHTDHTLFKNVIPEDECFVGPPVELEQLNNENSDVSKLFKIKIPHCIRHSDMWKKIKVRYGNIHKSDKFDEVPQKAGGNQANIWYKVNARFVTIYTKHFSHFTCSACNYKCTAAAMIFLFGNLRISPHPLTTRVKVKAFIGSELYVIKDYKEDLERNNRQYGLYSLAEQGTTIENDDFDPEKSQVTMKLAAEDSENWLPPPLGHDLWKSDGRYFCKEKVRLPSVIHLENCHNCRKAYPWDSMTVDMKTSRHVQEFHGQFNMTIHAASKKKDSDSGATKVDYTVNISFEVKSQSSERVHVFKEITENNDQTVSLKLNDKHILDVASVISDTTKLHYLGLELGLKYSEISTIQTNNRDDITQAALKMLHKWNDNQPNPQCAFTTLTKVLKNVGLNTVINEVFSNK